MKNTVTEKEQASKFSAWPVGIVIAFVTFAVLIIGSVMLMWQQKIPLVSENYYAEEIAFQEQIDKEVVTGMMKKHPAIRYQADLNKLEILFPLDTAFRKTVTGELHFFRPSDADLDQKLQVQPSEDGLQMIDLENFAHGSWILKINWSEGGVKFYHEETIFI